jgi:hypothetical protein
MKCPAIPFALLLAACNAAPTAILPPPFGPDSSSPQPARLFFPTGMAVTTAGNLLVANGNFDHAYDAGTIVSISGTYLQSFFDRNKTVRCDKVASSATCDEQIPPSAFIDAALIGNYAGPLVLDPAGTAAYTGSRDTSRLNGVSLVSLTDNHIYCRNGAAADHDCRAGVLDLRLAANLEGPYSIVPGLARLPGTDADLSVLFVAPLVPHIDEIQSGTIYTSAPVAALDVADPTIVRFSMLAASRIYGGGDHGAGGVGPMVFDPVRRQLLMGGCFIRYATGAGGDAATSKCGTLGTNTLRVLDVDAGSAAQVQVYDLTQEVRSLENVAMLLAGGDAASGKPPDTLWASARSPDVLIEVALPATPSQIPKVRRVVSLPASPADIALIRRPGGADLLAITAERLGALVIYDTGNRQVVAQVERLGDTPFTLKLLPSPAGSARLVASVFGDCRLSLIEVPLDQPWNAALRGRAGKCP